MTKREVLEAAARGEGCLGRSAEDEPVFIVCARDTCSVDTIRAWASKAEAVGAAAAKIDGAYVDVVEFTKWQAEHGTKVPD